MKRNLLTTCFWALACLLAALAVLHCCRAGLASVLYYQSRYGHKGKDPAAALDQARRAHALYPHNYLLAISAGKQAFYAGRGATNGTERLQQARHWSAIAFGLCPFNSEAAHLRAEVLALDSLPDAIALWERYRDRVFWEPFNHWLLVDLYVRAGEWDRAAEALYWLKDTPLFKPAEDMIRRAQLTQSRQP